MQRKKIVTFLFNYLQFYIRLETRQLWDKLLKKQLLKLICR